jgi:N-acetylglucosaminyldiphosphoundecaprenol N-acetyl-beta-D-mannosaminyltransferase
METPKQFSVLNLPVHLMNDYSNWLINRLGQKLGTQVVTLNAEMTMMALDHPQLAQVIKKAELVIPDGAGIIFYLWRKGQKQKRCPGIELASSLVEKLGRKGESCPICLYGGTPEVSQQAAKYWQDKIPEVFMINNHGYLSETEQEQWLKTLQETQPKLILVGLGVPRQELWISQHRYLCPEAVWIGVGGSFDVWAGVKSRAPKWLRDLHLEWLYRLYKEPWRWRRMLALPKFFLRTLF